MSRSPISWEASHAVIAGWLDADHNAQVKPYAIAPPTVRGDRLSWQVRLLDDALAGRLIAETTPGTPVRLDSSTYTVAAVPTLDHGTAWTVLAKMPSERGWWVEFASPVTFKRNNRSSPWPAPHSVLASLATRWQALDPATAPVLTRTTIQSVWVADLEGASRPFTLKDTVVSGFTGRLRYICDGTDQEASTVASLFAFARYANIGAHTAYGLGAVHVTCAPLAREQRRPARPARAVVDVDDHAAGVTVTEPGTAGPPADIVRNTDR